MSYCFVCLFRADKGTSGLALRIPLLWKQLSDQGEDVSIVINQSLYDKTLSRYENISLRNVYIIPEFFDFKFSSLSSVPPLLIYLILIKKVTKFHLSVGGAYFIDYIRFLSKVFSKKIAIHTSIGSKNMNMIVNGNLDSRYYKLHRNLMLKADMIDCLYSPKGFPEYSYKCIQSPGSFSWKYSTQYINNIKSDTLKTNNIVFSGSLIPQKNYILAIEAYKKLSESFDLSDNNPSLIIIAPYVPEKLNKEITYFNKSSKGNILFERYCNIDNILKTSLVFLSLQDYDNYPSQSLIEAMAFGCTVIATDSGETNKIVKEDYGNILVDCEVDSLLKAYIQVLKPPYVFNKSNKFFIINNHTMEKYARHFKDNFLL